MKALRKKWELLGSIIAVILLPGLTKAQSFHNLTFNGSFETYTQCPNNSSQIYYATPWSGPTTNSTDYLNACSPSMNVPFYAGVGSSYPAYLLAKDGVAYAGLYTYQLNNYREYAQVELKDTLSNGSCYYVEFYATNTQWIKYKTNNISAAFSSVEYSVNLMNPGIIPNLPQHITNYGNPVLKDTVKWEKISGIYQASGVEKYLLIGNFKDDSHTDTVNVYPKGSFPYSGLSTAAYIFIDAVSVYSIDPYGMLPWSYRDTTINQGDSVYIGNKVGGMNFQPQWFTANGSFIKTSAGITVSPTITTAYHIQYTLCGVQRTDTVKVTVINETDVSIKRLSNMRNQFSIYPNPANDKLNIVCEPLGTAKDVNYTIIDGFGRVIRETTILFSEGKASVDTNSLPDGVYFVRIGTSDGPIDRRFFINR